MPLHAGWINGNNAACSTVGINASSSAGGPPEPGAGAAAGAEEGRPAWPAKMEEGRVEKVRRERRATRKRSDMAMRMDFKVGFVLVWFFVVGVHDNACKLMCVHAVVVFGFVV